MHNLHRNLSGGYGKRQAGFIQNFIIPGLILIGVVIAGIAMLSSGSSGNADNERASMLANTVMGQSLSVAQAIQRAEGDGAIAPATVSTAVDLTSAGALVTGRYMISAPALPAEITSGAWTYLKAHTKVQAGAVPADLGTVAADDVLKVPLNGSLAKSVCLRINNKLFGTSTLPATAMGSGNLTVAASTVTGVTGAPVGATEGCIQDSGAASAYTYFRTVNVF